MDDWINEVVEPPMPPHPGYPHPNDPLFEDPEMDPEKKPRQLRKEREERAKEEELEELLEMEDAPPLPPLSLSTKQQELRVSDKKGFRGDEEILTKEFNNIDEEPVREGSACVRIMFGSVFVRFCQSSNVFDLSSYYLPFCSLCVTEWSITYVKVPNIPSK